MILTRCTITTARTALRNRWMAAATRSSSSSSSTGVPAKYSPTMTEARGTEVGHGGRGSDKGLKVACFGASGFLGRYVAAELGKLPKRKQKRKHTHMVSQHCNVDLSIVTVCWNTVLYGICRFFFRFLNPFCAIIVSFFLSLCL